MNSGYGNTEYDDGGYDRNRGYARGRGRGRGRGFRSLGRGGYNGPPVDAHEERGYNYEPPAQARGNIKCSFYGHVIFSGLVDGVMNLKSIENKHLKVLYLSCLSILI